MADVQGVHASGTDNGEERAEDVDVPSGVEETAVRLRRSDGTGPD